MKVNLILLNFKEFMELLDPTPNVPKHSMSEPIYISILGGKNSGKTSFIKAQLFLNRTEGCSFDDERSCIEGQETVISNSDPTNEKFIPCTLFEISNNSKKEEENYKMILKSEAFIVLFNASTYNFTTTDEISSHLNYISTVKEDHDFLNIIVATNVDSTKNEIKQKFKHLKEKFYPDKDFSIFETSSITFDNIQSPFKEIMKQILVRRKKLGYE
jgi:hypothetical protein